MAVVSAPFVSLFTAAAVLTAFRLPALMMFRGIRSPFRRPVMVVKMPPMARSMPGFAPPPNSANMSYPLPSSSTVPSNSSYIPPYLYPYPFPYPYPPPPPIPMPIPHPYHIRPSPPPPLSHAYIPLKTTKQPFYNQIFFEHHIKHERVTTYRPNHKYRPLYHNKAHKSAQQHLLEYMLKSKPTRKQQALHHNSIDDEHKYANMYPMPRNYHNHRLDEPIPQTTQLPPTSTLPPTTTTSTTTTTRRKTTDNKEKLRPEWLSENELKNIPMELMKNAKRFTTPSSVSPNNRGMNGKLRFTRIRVRTTTTQPMTTTKELMTPAPLENYRPVRARKDHKKRDPNERLMFDETQNLYYYVTAKSIRS